MISEKQLSEHFHSFWQEHFPLLDPSFVKRFNLQRAERVKSAAGNVAPPITKGGDIERFDLVAELAFELAIEHYKKRMGGIPNETDAIQRAVKRTTLLQRATEIPNPSADEISQAHSLVGNYDQFFETIAPEGPVQFRPRIKGVGILNEMEGDFCTTKTLFEVKAVDRKIQPDHLRQVICYFVAGIGSRQYAWTDYCIFNPRKAVSYRGRVDDLLGYLSGRTAPECIRDFLDALLEREQPLEAKF